MFNDAKGYSKIFIVTGRTDLRGGIDKLSATLYHHFQVDPFFVNSIFIFCGRQNKQLKALVWEGDGFLLLNKRLERGSFKWPRDSQEVLRITQEQYDWLMKGFSVEPPIKQVFPKGVV